MTKLLYHYTAGKSLLSILGEMKVWATDIAYLNDAAEFEYAMKWTRKRIDSHRWDNDYDGCVTWLLQRIGSELPRSPVYVFSMSEYGDQLSQWRAYGPSAGGFSIGFRRDILEDFAAEHGFNVVRCIYDENEHQKLLEPAIKSALAAIPDHDVSRSEFETLSPEEQARVEAERAERYVTLPNGDIRSDARRVAIDFWAEIMALAPSLKHSSFSEEGEWRLIARDLESVSDLVQYRMEKSFLVPYIALGPLPREAVAKVFVGPCPHRKQARQSATDFVKSLGFVRAKVVNSRVPYRDW